MRYSRYFIPTLKESPSDADTVSAKLMLRAGMIRKVAAGLYDWLPLGLRVLKKVEGIVREEMNRVGGMEVWLPHVQPKELWEESGRWQYYGKELLRFKDRKNGEFCFAPTAEEIITDLARRDLRSYRDMSRLFYQFGTKFRDEIRPRFGIMRAREFYMKDAYSFHASDGDLNETYQRVFDAYSKTFERLGLKFRPVEADTGTIGGTSSHEFMVLAETGEESIASCPKCGYAANIERAETVAPSANGQAAPLTIEEVSTPNKSRVDDVAAHMGVGADKVIKTIFLIADSQPVVALLRGDTELNEPKLMRLLGAKLMRPASEEEYKSISGSDVGYAGPMKLKAKIVADALIPLVSNGVAGAHKKDVHLKNVNYGRDYKADVVGDIRNIRVNDPCPRCQTPVAFFKGIEVGHVFKLGIKYSEAMKATYLDEGGKAHPMIMGCYGIGVSRIVAAAIEQNSDNWGICWPVPLAPFEVIVTPANITDEKTRTVAEKIYGDLQKAGVDVLFDDRDERAGIKFKDADLIGIPFRVTIGEKSLAKNVVELKVRTAEKAEEIPIESISADVVRRVQALRT
jgi:prolyl-tRNA synthetase